MTKFDIKRQSSLLLVPVVLLLVVAPSLGPNAIFTGTNDKSIASASATTQGPSPAAAKSSVPLPQVVSPATVPGTICSPGVFTSGIVEGPGGGEWLEDWSTGNLIWCTSAGVPTMIKAAPSGGSSGGYYGMAGISTGIGEIIGLDSWGNSPPGLWLCFGATPTGCAVQSPFIPLPSSFCSSLPAGLCNPDGMTFDGKLNAYIPDTINADVYKCTFLSGYQSCTVIETLTGFHPQNAVKDSSGNLWVSDESCAGNIWKNGVLFASVGDAIEGITFSKLNPSSTTHLYVADTGICSGTQAHILDVTDGTSLASTYPGSNEIPGLTAKFKSTSFTTGLVLQTKDTS